MRRILRGALSALLVAAQLIALAPRAPAALEKSLGLRQAETMAIAGSPEIKKKYNEIILKEMKYVESVKTVQAKAKNLRSFRWSPLLSFKFPQKLDLVEEYDLEVKPLTLQAEITTLRHEYDDLRFEMIAKAGRAFIGCFMLQEKIAFTEERLGLAEEEFARNSARLLLGEATQTDVDKMRTSVEKLEGDLTQQKREYEAAKKELSDLVGLDVSTGYRFTNPLRTADITREQLKVIEEYTVANDHAHYAMRMTASTALLNLNSYEELMRSQYGGKMSAIDPFVLLAKQGGDVDYTAFKIKYDEMLKSFDKPWDGKMKILFFTFTMEWFKGEISGTRYVEDEMYALYTACQEYGAALKDEQSSEKALRKQVNAEFEALVTAKNAAAALEKQLGTSREQLDRVAALNRLGKAEYSELKDAQEDYQSVQLELMDALASYNELLIGFDRLSCGAVTKLLAGDGLDTDAGSGGDSFVTAEEPTYHIYTDVADLVFVFSVSIPEDYEPAITHYELWYEGTQIGARTEAAKQLRHLAIDYGETHSLTVRVFDEDDYVDECVIDTSIPSDRLPFPKVTPVEAPAEREVGTYTVATSGFGEISLSELKISPSAGSGAAFFRVKYGENGDIYTSALTAVTEPLNYLTLMIASLDDVTVELYDKSEALLYTARFNQADQTLRAPSDAGEGQ